VSRWETSSELSTDVRAPAVWERPYADVAAWPRWNAEIKRAGLDGPLRLGAQARIVFRTGLRLRFHVVEFEQGHVFADEARLPGARMGHRHLIEPADSGGCRLTNTIYIEGALAWFWRRVLGPAAARTLPAAQRAIVALAAEADQETLGRAIPRR
jgi:Polyketide cyclase / dehydrase and lipid transport